MEASGKGIASTVEGGSSAVEGAIAGTEPGRSSLVKGAGSKTFGDEDSSVVVSVDSESSSFICFMPVSLIGLINGFSESLIGEPSDLQVASLPCRVPFV